MKTPTLRDGYNNQFDVLLFDPSRKHAASIVEAVQAIGISATAFQSREDFLQALDKQKIDLAVIALDSKSWWRDELRLLCNSIRYVQEKPDIICFLRWPPTNPLDKLYGDTLGVEVLHEW